MPTVTTATHAHKREIIDHIMSPQTTCLMYMELDNSSCTCVDISPVLIQNCKDSFRWIFRWILSRSVHIEHAQRAVWNSTEITIVINIRSVSITVWVCLYAKFHWLRQFWSVVAWCKNCCNGKRWQSLRVGWWTDNQTTIQWN